MIVNILKSKYTHLILLAMALVLASIKAPFIEVDASISQFFHEDDADFVFYQKIASEFDNQENLILLGIQHQDSVFDIKFIKQINRFSDDLKTIPNVKKVNSLLNVSYPVKNMLGFVGVRYLKITKENSLLYNKQKILNETISQNFINQKGDALFLWIEIEENLDSKKLDILINNLNSLRKKWANLTTFMWGRNVIDVTFKNILIEEILTFGCWIFIFLCLSFLYIFKKPIALFFPILLVIIVIILFMGGMVSLGRPISTMSNLFPTIILIVAVSDVIHLCIQYDKESKKNTTPKCAIKNTLKEVGFTTFITSFTTAIGFLVLYFSPMKAMRNFGIESAFLVIITFLLTLIYLPIFLNRIQKENSFAISDSFNSFAAKIFKQLNNIYSYKNTVIIVFAIILVVCSYGITQINTNSSHYAIPKKTDLYDSYQFFEANFGGSRTFELVLSTQKEEQLIAPELLNTVFTINNYLKLHPDLNAVKSPFDNYLIMHQAYHPADYKKIPFPLNSKTIQKYDRQLSVVLKKNYLSNKANTLFKFQAQMQELGKHKTAEIQKKILNNVNHLIGEKPIEARLSGIDLLIDLSQQKSIQNTFWGLLIAIGVISITLALVFKSISLGFLAIFLNIIPLVITAGIMGYAQVDLRAEIALIFTVGFVIAVDDTIHLLSKFQWERNRGASVEVAIKTAVLDCGKAILATSIILVGGFFILMISDSSEIFTLGLLVGIIVSITLCVDLILAPILILKWFQKYL